MLPFKPKLNNHHPTEILPLVWLDAHLKKIAKGEEIVEIDFVDDVSISELNFSYKGKKAPTDVLAFDFGRIDKEKVGADQNKLRGEIIISVDTAKRQAEERMVSLRMELLLLCIHGLLHILGECDEKISSKKKMKQKELFLLLKSCEKV